MPSRLRLSTALVGAAILVAVLFGLALHGTFAPGANAAGNGYHQTNLIADVAGQAAVTDANLVNPWGLVAGPTTPWWVSDNHTGFSTVYSGAWSASPGRLAPRCGRSAARWQSGWNRERSHRHRLQRHLWLHARRHQPRPLHFRY